MLQEKKPRDLACLQVEASGETRGCGDNRGQHDAVGASSPTCTAPISLPLARPRLSPPALDSATAAQLGSRTALNAPRMATNP